MANRTTFLFFTSWAKQLRDLPREQRCDVYDAIIEYAENGTLPTNLTGEAKMAFKFIQCDVDRAQNRYDEICEKRRESARRGARVRWGKSEPSDTSAMPNASNCEQMLPNASNCCQTMHKDKDKDKDDSLPNGSDGNNNKPNKEKSPNGDNKKKATKQFERPTLEEVQAYIAEKHYSVDPEMWFSYYESNGWKVGRCTMKDWKRAIVYWESKNKQRYNENTRPRTENRRGSIDETHPKLEEYDESF